MKTTFVEAIESSLEYRFTKGELYKRIGMDVIILCTEDSNEKLIGTVIHNNEKVHPIGHHSKYWNEDVFTYVKGIVTINTVE